MTLYALSVRRPVLAVVMSLVILLFGGIGLSRLGVRAYPAVDPPVVSVQTNYRGASAEVMESQITEVIESAVNGVSGIVSLTSTSSEGRSSVRAEFAIGSDLEVATNDVRDRVAQAIRQLPPDAEPPVVSKADANDQPIIFVGVRSETRDLLSLTQAANDYFAERLQSVPDVAGVDIWGARRYAMRISLDPVRLAAYDLTPLDVRNALLRENIELPSGRIEGTSVELSVRTLSRLDTADDFNDLILKSDGPIPVRLRDVGNAELGALNARTVLRRDGIPMVGVVVRPLPGANTIAITDAVRERVEQIKVGLPEDLTVAYGFDNSIFIRQAVREVAETIGLSLFLVVMVILFFLRSGRTTFIPVLVIPVSLIGAFFVLYLADFSVNVLTLLGVVLAIGLVVDDAIIVLENIYAKLEAGMKPEEAAIQGTKEIFFAVVSTTLALVAVFLPLMFLGGLTGRLFREFGVTIGAAVVLSSFAALTLVPMLSYKLLGRRRKPSAFYTKTEPFFVWLSEGYKLRLERFLKVKWLAFPIIAACAGMIYLFLNLLPQELAPQEDRSEITIRATAPEGATFAYMDAYITQLRELVQAQVPEIESIFTVTSPGFGGGATNAAFARLTLVPPEERELTQQQVADKLTGIVNRLGGARAFVAQPPTISAQRGGGLPVQYVIQAQNFEDLAEILPAFLERAQRDPAFTFVDSDLKFTKPELRVRFDRDRLRSLGISATDVAQTLQLGLSEGRVSNFIMDGKQYEVILAVDQSFREATGDVSQLFVRNAAGASVQLRNVIQLQEESAPPSRFRYNRFIAATVSAGLAEGVTLGQGIEAMDGIAAEVLDDRFQTSLAGQSREFAESNRSLLFVFILALLLVYLILSAQFESFIDPLVIMLTVPLALSGALLSLWYFEHTLNIFSQIGLILLIGLVTKNGILLVEFANQRRDAGLGVLEATVEAAAARLRPILMTSFSTILGILPIALALGAGAESRVPMGVAVVGGLSFGTFLTLFVVPAFYILLTAYRSRVADARSSVPLSVAPAG